MVYTFLISIVFIAEIIIAISILKLLFDIDKKVINLSNTLENRQNCIKDICVLSKKISEQIKIISEDFVDKVKTRSEDMALKSLSKVLISLLVLNLNFKVVKKVRKSKITKTLVKGFNLLENMI